MDMETRRLLIDMVRWMDVRRYLTEEYQLIPYEIAEMYMENDSYKELIERRQADKKPISNVILHDVSRSTLLPEGFKVYKCSDCGSTNVKRDNGEIRVGFCDECEHPLWN